MNYSRGIATLPTIMLMGVLILAVGIEILSLGLSESVTSSNQANASSALFYADTGARDALLRIARNKDYSCTTASCYTIDMTPSGCVAGNGCAAVSVSAGTGAAGDPKIVTSTGTLHGATRTLQVSIIFDTSVFGQFSTVTWQELTN